MTVNTERGSEKSRRSEQPCYFVQRSRRPRNWAQGMHSLWASVRRRSEGVTHAPLVDLPRSFAETGRVQCAQVLHIDRNNYYGGASASLQLNQVGLQSAWLPLILAAHAD